MVWMLSRNMGNFVLDYLKNFGPEIARLKWGFRPVIDKQKSEWVVKHICCSTSLMPMFC